MDCEKVWGRGVTGDALLRELRFVSTPTIPLSRSLREFGSKADMHTTVTDG